MPGAGSEEVLPRHRGEGRLDLRISDAGGRRDLLPIGPPDDLQFALAIHLGRIWLVRRSGQDSTAFECRVLAANRNPVAEPMPAETMFPLSELDRMLPLSDTALHTAAGSERGRRSSRPSVSSRGTRTILKEPETRRLKNRGHLARNRKFESISLQQTVCLSPAVAFEGREPMAQADDLLTPAQIEKAMIVGVKIKEALARSHKAGVTIAFGTDMGVGPHGQNAREFGFMVEAGMHSREAIKAATVNAAKLLDVSDEVGTIASGKSADVIAVDSSPLDDVSVLQRMAFVMARGDVYLGVT